MRKFSWNKVLNITTIIAITLLLASCLCLPYFYKPHPKVEANELVEGVPFKIGIMNRTATAFVDNTFNYIDGEPFWPGEVATIAQDEYVMLENYNAEKSLVASAQNSESIQNIFISFGMKDTEKYIITLNVFLKVNGVDIYDFNQVQSYENLNLPENNTTARYWYDYLDGKAYGEGLYEFRFDYSYADGEHVHTGNTYTYSFYLIDQAKYTEYPTLNNVSTGVLDSYNIKQFYYNYTVQTLPTLTYDASRYNISYVKDKNKDSETVTSTFTVNTTTKLGTVTFTKTTSSSGKTTTTTETIKDIAKVDGAYPITLYFDELGTYTFTIQYLLSIGTEENPEYTLVDKVLPYDVNDEDYNLTEPDGSQKLNPAQRGKLKMHIYGVKAYFAKNGGTELKQKENNTILTQADVTHLIYDKVGDNDSFARTLGNGIYRSANINGSIPNPLISFTNYPTTNMVPIDFDYYGTFKYQGEQPLSTYKVYSDAAFTKEIEGGYITKDSNLDTPGYYEVIIKYSFDLYTTSTAGITGGSKLHYQVFLFKISSTAPSMTLTAVADDNSETIIKNKAFTNKKVSVTWQEPTYFQSEIKAEYSKYNFDGSIDNGNKDLPFTQGQVIGDGSDGHYYVRLYYNSLNQDVYVENSFTIDKTSIQDSVKIQPIYARKEANSNKIIGYGLVTDKNETDFNNSKLINQPFTLTYDQKESGAKITTKYYKIPFANYVNAGYSQTISSKKYIDTNYQIDPANMISGGTYNLNYNSIAAGLVSSENAFIDEKSFIYYFEIEDEAGNTASTYVIYDLTKPYIIVDSNAVTPEIDAITNPYGILTKQASITWGDYKGVKVKATVTEDKVENQYLQKVIDSETTLFKNLDGIYYLCVPITSVEFAQGSNNYSFTSASANSVTANSVTIYPQLDDNASNLVKFFSGDDKIYTYKISDASNIKSLTNISNNIVVNGFVRMFLDNAQGIAYGNFSSNLDNNTFSTYEDLLPGTSSAKQLRFTYLPGEPGSGYEVDSVSYTYYDFAEKSYASLENISSTTTTNGVPYPIYPFNKLASATNVTLKASSAFTTRKGSTGSSEQECVVTEIINPTSENGPITTKPGMYVIKRTYKDKEGFTFDTNGDGKIRYYVYYVDRTGIIEINTDVPDSNIYQEDRSDMLYETGSGILFNFSKADEETKKYKTYYTALQIQQYIQTQISDNNVFTSNKLPITLYLPTDKYNTRYTLRKSDFSTAETQYISSTVKENNFNFGLKYEIVFNDGTTDTRIFENIENPLNPNTTYISIPSNYLSFANDNGYYPLTLKSEGTYTVYLYDTSDNRTSQQTANSQNIQLQHNNSYSFSFTISHEYPSGEYTSKYNDANRTEMMFDQKSTNETLGVTTFNSFNNDALVFKFRKEADPYKAEIDPKKVKVDRIANGNTTTIYVGTTENSDVFKFVPDVVNADGTESTTGEYLLTIFDEYEYKNNNKTFVGGTGSNRDYMLAKSQNIEYVVTLEYDGDVSDYQIMENGTVVKNYFTHKFRIILDRIKPQFNYQSIVSLDNQKFAANSTSNTNIDSYFYTINKDFEFIQNPNLGGVLDSETIYYRRLYGKSATCDYPDYFKTYTPDDDNYYENGNINHIRFSESNIGDGENNTFASREYIGNKLKASDLFGDSIENKGYYEVIEKDQAGNYKVYAIYYNPDSSTNIIHYEYDPAIVTDADSGVIPYTQNGQTYSTDEILGNNLRFTEIENLGFYQNDYFYKCIIKYGTTTLPAIINNPNDRNDSNSWTDFLNRINEALEFTNTITKDGYKVTITFVNRLSQNHVITYRVPGDRLSPEPFPEIDSSHFKVIIPKDSESTYIKEFHVWKFTNGEWIEQSQDSTGLTIIKSYSSGASLQNAEYIFGEGEFKFQLIDNFERGRDLEEYPPYYKGMGVNDVRTISYGTNVNVDNVTHTASNVSFSYQTNLYLLNVYSYNNETNKYTLIEEKDFTNKNITEQSITNGVRTLIFQNNAKDTIKQFKIVLVVEKTKTEYIYEFAINKVLPEIVLNNQSGGKLITSAIEVEPTIHTENFYVTWDTNHVFTSYVTLIRNYIDSNGKQQTQTISNISNGYEVNLPGTYTAKITNNLGYSDNNHNIYFKLVSGEIVVYDVVQINNGIETILHPSPKDSSITIDGVKKVLKNYYTLASFDNPIGSDKFIELRANKNKGIEYELLEFDTEEAGDGPINTNTNTLIKKVYKIYGTSNYAYERYIQIIFVDEKTNADGLGFTGITAFHPTANNNTMTQLTLSSEVTTNVSYIDLSWKAYNKTSLNYDDLRGNLIYLDYYFNGNFVRRIFSETLDTNTLRISNAGIHKFRLYDLAGTKQMFGPSSEMVINLVNSVLFTVNGTEPINNRIFNGDVIIEITNRHLYYTDPVVTATLSYKEITPQRVGTSFYQYKFSEHGYYEVEITTQINQNETVKTKYCFTIINQNMSLPCFSVPQNANFTVSKVLKQNADITHTLESFNELWISPSSLGSGMYTITLSQWNDALNTDLEFDFQIWVNNEVPYIYSDLPFGDSSTKNITLTFNPKIIYDQVGESYISITGEPRIDITAESINEITSYTLTANREYYIGIYSKDGKLINSYKVTKDEPLNTTSIIIIVVVSVVVVGLVVVFIVIRKHLKFR